MITSPIGRCLLARGKKNKFIETAQKHLQKQNYDKAIKEYLKAHKEDPKDVRVAQKLGDLYLKTKKKEESVKYFKMAGSIYARDGFHQRAIAVYRQILEVDKYNYDIRLEIATLYRKLGLMAEATPHFKESLKHFEEKGDRDKCLEIIKNLVELEPRSVGNRIKLAEMYLKGGQKDQGYKEFTKAADDLKNAGRWDDLVKLYEKLVKADPTNPDNLIGFGEALEQKSDFEKARESYKQVLKFKPDDLETLDRLVKVSTRMQDAENAVAYLKKKAAIVEKAGDKEEEKNCYRKILKLYPGDADAKRKLQKIGGKVEEAPPPKAPPKKAAVAEDDDVIPLDEAPDDLEVPAAPEPAPASDTASVSQEAAPQAAPPEDEEAIEVPTEDQIPSLLTEADVYLRYGLIDKARQYVKSILKGFPTRHEALRLDGLLNKEQGLIKEAVDSLLLAVSAARAEGDDGNARAYIEELLVLDPDNSLARNHLEELNAGVEIDIGIEESDDVPPAPSIDQDILTIEDSTGPHAAEEERLELADGEDEIFSFVEESGDDQLMLVDDEDESAQSAKATQAAPEEDSMLFEIQDDVEQPTLDMEDDEEIPLSQPEPEPVQAAPPPPPPVEEPMLDVEEEPLMEVEAAPEPEPVQDVPPPPPPVEEPMLDVEEEPLMEVEAALEPEPVQVAPPPPPVAEPMLGVEEEPLMEVEAEPSISETPSVENAPVFEEIEEEEEEEEVELEEIGGAVLEEVPQPRPETVVAELTPTAPEPARPRKKLDSVLEDEWGDDEWEDVDVEEVKAEAPPTVVEETKPEPEPMIAEAPVPEPVMEEAGVEVEPEPEAPVAGVDLDDEWGEDEELEAPPAMTNSIEDVAEAADDAWSDALVGEEPDVAADAPNSVLEGMGEIADEVLGEVFGEEQQPGGDESDDLFDLCSVLSEEITDTDLGIECDDDMADVLGSFRERVKEEIGEDAETHFNLGIAYKEMGLLRDAIGAFQSAMKSGYSPSDSINMIGLCFMDLKEFAKAEQLFKEGLGIEELQEHEILGLKFDLGLALQSQNKMEEALVFYREVESVNPHFRDVNKIAKELSARVGTAGTQREADVPTGTTPRSKISYI